MKRSIERVLTVIGAVVVLVAGLDAVSYAATGKAFILGGTNTTTKTTVIKNTASGAVLSLQTKSNATPPLTVNSTGVVKNLDSDYLNGLHANQIMRGAMDPLTFTFIRTNANTTTVNASNGSAPGALVSDSGADALGYAVTGTVTTPCDPVSQHSASYAVLVALLDNNALQVVAFYQNLPLSSCGKPFTLPVTAMNMTATSRVVIVGVGENASAQQVFAPQTLTIALTGTPMRRDL